MSILISLSPNTEADDVRLALRTLLSYWRWRKTAVLKEAQAAIEQLIPETKVVLTSSGRSALYAILQTAGIGSGDEVIVQAYTCVAVPGAVTWTGAKPIYADIDPRTYNLDPAAVAKLVTPHTRAIIVQHIFGLPGPVAELQSLAKDHNLLLIEDFAHDLGRQDHALTGHVGFLSFGRDKIISAVFGGAVVSRDPVFIEKISSAQEQLPFPPLWWVCQQLLHPILLSFIKPLYFRGGKILLVFAQKLHLISKAVTPEERMGQRPIFLGWRFSPALAVLLLHQTQKLGLFTQRRIAAVEQYAARIRQFIYWRGLPLLRIPLRVANKEQVLQQAKAKHMLLGDWYRVAVEPCTVEDFAAIGYVLGSCPEAERAARETINLPTYPTMKITDSQRVINFITDHVTILHD